MKHWCIITGSVSGWSILPYLCRQVQFSTLPPEPVIPSKKPFRVELVGGKRYSWCTCGHSQKQVKQVRYISPVRRSHPVCSLNASPSFSLSATEPTNVKPPACCRCASSQSRTLLSGCVVASTQTAHLIATARTSRTWSCPLPCTSTLTPERTAERCLDWMKVEHIAWTTVTGVLLWAMDGPPLHVTPQGDTTLFIIYSFIYGQKINHWLLWL